MGQYWKYIKLKMSKILQFLPNICEKVNLYFVFKLRT